MHPNQRTCALQQRRVQTHASNSDPYTFFNLLTGPALLGEVEALLPEHRERLFPPTETLSMFLAQALSADRSCQNVVNDAAVRRWSGGCRGAVPIPAAIAAHATACRRRWSAR